MRRLDFIPFYACGAAIFILSAVLSGNFLQLPVFFTVMASGTIVFAVVAAATATRKKFSSLSLYFVARLFFIAAAQAVFFEAVAYYLHKEFSLPLLVMLFSMVLCGVTVFASGFRKYARKDKLFKAAFVFAAVAFGFSAFQGILKAFAFALFATAFGAASAAFTAWAEQLRRVAVLAEIPQNKVDKASYCATFSGMALGGVLWLLLYLLKSLVETRAAEVAATVLYYVFVPIMLIVSLCAALKIPLRRDYCAKLSQLSNPDTCPHDYALLKEQTVSMLTEKPISLAYLFMFAVLHPCFPCKVEGAENIKGAPAVFVANHYEIYGPLASYLRMPVRVRPWIINSMIDRDEVTDWMKTGIDNVFHAFPVRFRRFAAKLLSPLIVRVLSDTEPIPVWRGDTKKVFETLNAAVAAMRCGDNMLIFPEKPEEGEMYSQGGVDAFYSGFADVGKRYYRQSGRRVSFYPTYVDKLHKKIIIGSGIEYDPDVDSHDEKLRIASLLNVSMAEIAARQNK